MTDDEIHSVFVEFSRIGVDLGQPPGLAIGTGFREGELVPWLRSLPDNLGHERFANELKAHVSAAAPNVSADGQPRHVRRWWPTSDQLRAGAQVLVDEWDPLGARLGQLAHDDVSMAAYGALEAILSMADDAKAEERAASMLMTIEQEQFGVRPSPLEQRRYLARRLIQTMIDQPALPHEENLWEEAQRIGNQRFEIALAEGRAMETPRGRVVGIGPRGDEPLPYDPHAHCTECGVIGTVAFVMREREPVLSRYCPECWSKVRSKYWLHEHPRKPETAEDHIAFLDYFFDRMRDQVRTAGSALWDDVLLYTRPAITSEFRTPEERDQTLRRLADDLIRMEPRMVGPMPADIQAFVRDHRTSA